MVFDNSNYYKTNKNDFLHSVRFSAIANDEEIPHKSLEKFHLLFSIFDTNKNGELSPSEMQNFFDEIISLTTKENINNKYFGPSEALNFKNSQIEKIKNYPAPEKAIEKLNNLTDNEIFYFINLLAKKTKLESTFYDAKNLPKEINPELLTLENLKKAYPDEFFQIESKNEGKEIRIREKNNNNMGDKFQNELSISVIGDYITIDHYKNGYSLHANYINGKLDTCYSDKNNVLQEYSCLTQPIHNLINNPKLTESKKRELTNYLDSIDAINIKYLLNDYKTQYKSSLISDLVKLYPLYKNSKSTIEKIFNSEYDYLISNNIYAEDLKEKFDKELKQIFNHINYSSNNDKLNIDTTKLENIINELYGRYNSYNNVGNSEANGKIDNTYQQGRTGDCWLIAAIRALENNEKGKKILNESITLLDNGDIKVNLAGVGATYTIKKEEIEVRNRLATGDLDVRALEIAIDKYLYDTTKTTETIFSINKYGGFARQQDSLEGGLSAAALRFLVPTERIISMQDFKFSEKYLEKFNDKNQITVVGSTKMNNYRLKESSTVLLDHHAYTVVKYENNNVFLQNPHNPEETISVPKKDFIEFFNGQEILILDDYSWKSIKERKK